MPLEDNVKVINSKALLKLGLEGPIGGFQKVDVASAAVTEPQVFSLGPVTFGISAGADLSILAYNSIDDGDDDGVIGLKPKDGSLPPQILFRDDAAWLEYRMDGSIKASGGGSLSAVGF